MKLNKFGKLYLNNLNELNNVEMKVMSFISQRCSGGKPSSPPVLEIMTECSISKRQALRGISGLKEKGFLSVIRRGRRNSYYPAEKYFGKRFGMTQGEEMVKLSKNENKVYTYLSSLQGNKESCQVSMQKIMDGCVMKSLQMVKKTTASLVKKGVVKRSSEYKKSTIYYVMRHEKSDLIGAKNLPIIGAKNLPKNTEIGAKNGTPYNNILKDKNNRLVNNPASGERLTGFFEKEKIQKDNIEILENFKNKKKDNITVLESFSKSAHISFRKESVQNYRILLMTYISNLSPEVIDKMEEQGCSLNTYININVGEFLKYGIEDEISIKPENIKKISESDKKCLQDYVDKRKLDSGDVFLDEVKNFSRYMFTIGEHSQEKLRRIIKKIHDETNQSVVNFDFGFKSKEIGNSGKEVW